VNAVGPRVRQARVASGLTQSALAARLEVRGIRIDRAGVAKIEGRFRQVSDTELLALADALGVSPGWLLEADTPK
jgi:transcriptional regulator with XRE-family HTH domain